MKQLQTQVEENTVAEKTYLTKILLRVQSIDIKPQEQVSQPYTQIHSL